MSEGGPAPAGQPTWPCPPPPPAGPARGSQGRCCRGPATPLASVLTDPLDPHLPRPHSLGKSLQFLKVVSTGALRACGPGAARWGQAPSRGASLPWTAQASLPVSTEASAACWGPWVWATGSEPGWDPPLTVWCPRVLGKKGAWLSPLGTCGVKSWGPAAWASAGPAGRPCPRPHRWLLRGALPLLRSRQVLGGYGHPRGRAVAVLGQTSPWQSVCPGAPSAAPKASLWAVSGRWLTAGPALDPEAREALGRGHESAPQPRRELSSARGSRCWAPTRVSPRPGCCHNLHAG